MTKKEKRMVRLLSLIPENRVISPKALRIKLNVPLASIHRRLRRAERRGYVVIDTEGMDDRRWHIVITPTGLDYLLQRKEH